MLKMDLEYKKGILYARLHGSLNRKTSYKINCYLNPVLKKHKIKYLVYNLAHLKELDETGLDALLTSKYEMKGNAGQMVMCIKNKEVEEKIKKLKVPRFTSERKLKFNEG